MVHCIKSSQEIEEYQRCLSYAEHCGQGNVIKDLNKSRLYTMVTLVGRLKGFAGII